MYYMELKVNWEHRRCRHALERMWLRGLSMHEVKEALIKGQKVKQKQTGLIESFFRYYSVVYDENIYKNIKMRKIFPVTVKVW